MKSKSFQILLRWGEMEAVIKTRDERIAVDSFSHLFLPTEKHILSYSHTHTRIYPIYTHAQT